MSNSLVTPAGPVHDRSDSFPPDYHTLGISRPLMNRLPLSPVSRTIGFVLAFFLTSVLCLAATAKTRKHRPAAVQHAVVHKAASTSVPIRRAAVLSEIPLGRIATAEDVADALEFLVSPQSSYFTGQKLIVDGGQFMW